VFIYHTISITIINR